MIRKLMIAATVAVSLAGCATNPDQFAMSANNAVDNVETAAVATVNIGTALIRAILALHQPVRDTVNIIFD